MLAYDTSPRFAVLAVIVSVVLISQPAIAQEPSRSDTVAYINSKLSTCGVIKQEISISSYHLRIESAILVTRDVDSSESQQQWYPEDYSMSVRLEDLSTNVQTEYSETRFGFKGEVRINCAASQCFKLPVERMNWPTGSFNFIGGVVRKEGAAYSLSDPANAFRFFLCDPDDVERVNRAFVHLIRVSGGKDELF